MFEWGGGAGSVSDSADTKEPRAAAVTIPVRPVEKTPVVMSE